MLRTGILRRTALSIIIAKVWPVVSLEILELNIGRGVTPAFTKCRRSDTSPFGIRSGREVAWRSPIQTVVGGKNTQHRRVR